MWTCLTALASWPGWQLLTTLARTAIELIGLYVAIHGAIRRRRRR